MRDLVSIIIPHYNHAGVLLKAIQSVQQQTYSNWEIIIVDDGSDKDEFAKVERYANTSNIKVEQSISKIKGASYCRNQGISLANGKYVLFLDSDDLLATFCLEQRVEVMQQNDQLDWAIFNQYQCAPGATETYPFFNKPVKEREEAISYFLKMQPAWQTMAPLWKIEALRKLGGFDTSLYFMEDPDLHLRGLLDLELKVQIMWSLPADSYYFVANKSDEKLVSFYHNGIMSRFLFIKKTITYLPNTVPKDVYNLYRRFISEGFFIFLQTMLLSRMKKYKSELTETISFLKKKNVLSFAEAIKAKIIISLYTSTSSVVTKLKIKGIVHKLFLQKR